MRTRQKTVATRASRFSVLTRRNAGAGNEIAPNIGTLSNPRGLKLVVPKHRESKMKIQGAVAIVTGGASGIGFAFCKALLENEAASVTILDISEEGGEGARKKLESQHGSGSVTFIKCDVSNKEELERCFKKTVEDHGKLDILCNNAGIISGEKNWHKTIAVNLTAVIEGTYLAMEIMKSGVIVNTSSQAGFDPHPLIPVYCATKHAVIGFSRSVAPICLKKGIRINCICPGVVDTPSLHAWTKEDENVAKILKSLTLMEPEIVAKGLIQLIGDDTKNGEAMMVLQNRITYHQFVSVG